jgi:hypothetical protein
MWDEVFDDTTFKNWIWNSTPQQHDFLHWIYNDTNNYKPDLRTLGSGVGYFFKIFANEKTYRIRLADKDKYLKFGITPIDIYGLVGTEVKSDAIHVLSHPPEARNVYINGNVALGSSLLGSYVYYDEDGEPEGTSLYQWYYSTDGAIWTVYEGETTDTHIITSTDITEQRYLMFRVVPVDANTPPLWGNEYYSASFQIRILSGTKIFTTTGSWTPNTAEGKTFKTLIATNIYVIGGGGGGGPGSGGAHSLGGAGGGAGSSGGYVTAASITLTGGTTYSATVGTKGTGGAMVAYNILTGNNGTNGVDSVLAGSDIVTLTAIKGNFGGGAIAATTGGTGGSAPVGGNAGSNGNNAAAGHPIPGQAGGVGGAAPYLTYGQGGDGGRGGDSNTGTGREAGDNGTDGVIVIEWSGAY